eukprot:2868052-Amphidinium_carterae.1
MDAAITPNVILCLPMSVKALWELLEPTVPPEISCYELSRRSRASAVALDRSLHLGWSKDIAKTKGRGKAAYSCKRQGRGPLDKRLDVGGSKKQSKKQPKFREG